MGKTITSAAVGGLAAVALWVFLVDAPEEFRIGFVVLFVAGGAYVGVSGKPHAKLQGGALYGLITLGLSAALFKLPLTFILWFLGLASGLAAAASNPVPPHRSAAITTAAVALLMSLAVGLAVSTGNTGPLFAGNDNMRALTGNIGFVWITRLVALGFGVWLARHLGGQTFREQTGKKDRLIEYRSNPANRVALVFVHGFLGDARDTWENMAKAIMQNPNADDWDIYSFGYATSLNLEMAWSWTADPDLETVTKKLRTEAKYSSKLKRYERYAIAAHSMGGLVAQRAILDDADFREQVDLVMLFGTPSNGQSSGWADFLKRQVADMDPKGPFIRSLRAEWDELWARGKPGFRFYTIAGSEDGFIRTSTSHDPFPEEQQRVVAGNHLTMVEPEGPDDEVVQLVVGMLQGEGEDTLRWNSAQLAIERGDFHKAIESFAPHVEELDAHTLRRLALAYAATGQQEKAIAILEEYGHRGGTDAMGILGGQFKRRWLLERRREDAERSLSLYGQAFETAVAAEDHDQAYYHAINLAFLALAYQHQPEAAAGYAKSALEHCGKTGASAWRSATEAEARLYLGDSGAALQGYDALLNQGAAPLSARDVRSMYKQAQAVAEAAADPALAKGLDAIFQKNV